MRGITSPHQFAFALLLSLALCACGEPASPEPAHHLDLETAVVQRPGATKPARLVFDLDLDAIEGQSEVSPVEAHGDMTLVQEFERDSEWRAASIELSPSSTYAGSLRLTTLDVNDDPTCSGARPLAVSPEFAPRETILVCALPEPLPPGQAVTGPDFGDELVIGNLCPQQLVLAPQASTVAPGGSTGLVAGGVDPEGEPLAIEWLTTGGTVTGDLGSFTFHCDEHGSHSITMVVSDGDPHCDRRRAAEVFCQEE